MSVAFAAYMTTKATRQCPERESNPQAPKGSSF